MRLIAATLALALLMIGSAEAKRPDRIAPTAHLTSPAAGGTVSGAITLAATAQDNVAVDHVTFRVDGTAVGSDSTAPYSLPYDTTRVVNGNHAFSVRAADTSGNVSADSQVTATVANGVRRPQCSDGLDNDGDGKIDYPADPGCTDALDNDEANLVSGPVYYTRLSSHLGGPAHTDAFCTSNLTATTAEPRPDNYPANSTPGDPASALWGTEVDPRSWTKWGAKRAQVTGAFTGVTTLQFQWAACKWGLNEDWLRAAGVQETDWHQYLVGDNCGPLGEASYGIIQVKNRYCSGSLAWGGYPQTQRSTSFALDFYGAYLRSCFDGDFYDGGSWLYGGQTVDMIAATRGWDYVMWGCVGSWFSGGWYDSGASSYINSVKNHLSNRDWTKY
jgi:hypothetical protein